MHYRKFEGDNWLHRDFVVRQERYAVVSHRVEGAGGDIAFASEGRKAVVYQLRHARGTMHALKVFHKKFALFTNFLSALQLRPYATVTGLSVCQRDVLLEGDATSMSEPGLEFAVLMPWMPGKAWAEIIAEKDAISERQCIALARKMADVLAGLEQRKLAHADISSSNVFVVVDASPTVELIDVEDMYHQGFLSPAQMPAGTPGYNYPRCLQTGNWNAFGDRFAGAVILAEMLTWHQPGIREASDELSYFHRDEMCRPRLSKYDLLRDAVQSHSRDAAALLDRAWKSPTLDACPSFAEWRTALAAAQRSTTLVAARKAFLVPPRLSYFTLQKELQTELLSRYACFECGHLLGTGKAGDHAPTCSQHSSKLKPLFDPSEVYRSPYFSKDPASPSTGPTAQAPLRTVSTCTECRKQIFGNISFMHAEHCSHRAPGLLRASSTCDECGNLVSKGDGSDHRPLCSKHPAYTRTQPSRFRNVRFMPLADGEPKPTLASPLAGSEPLNLFGRLCPECMRFVVPGSSTRTHGLLCSKRTAGG